MQRVRYLGPAHVLVTMEGDYVPRGGVAEVSDREADFMASSPHTWIEFEGGPYESEAEFLAHLEPEAEPGAGQSTDVKE